MPALYIGLMSGTSLDGIDAVLVDFAAGPGPLRVLAHEHAAFDPAHAAEMLALNRSGADELHRAALAANALARACAALVHRLLERARIAPGDVRAIGAHGQTVRHRPGEFDGTGYTLQLNAAALLAELTGIDVAADFRSRDVAAGGQGAPLVPAFHREMFARAGETHAVLNLGGMSNLSVLRGDGTTLGFDCGPGNALLDGWVARHRGVPFDDRGVWAAGGTIQASLLVALRADPFFALPPPKSTGRDHFHLGWVDAAAAGVAPQDVQATLAELTASICADAVRAEAPDAVGLVVCGGGARNDHLMARLRTLLPIPVLASDELGLPADQVEACAFAWLAQALVERRPGNLPAVTGARGPRILGAIYPGR
jgi:anhydro-N-acetylmuramic acid kinase